MPCFWVEFTWFCCILFDLLCMQDCAGYCFIIGSSFIWLVFFSLSTFISLFFLVSHNMFVRHIFFCYNAFYIWYVSSYNYICKRSVPFLSIFLTCIISSLFYAFFTIPIFINPLFSNHHRKCGILSFSFTSFIICIFWY
jgi:hypothetical protein